MRSLVMFTVAAVAIGNAQAKGADAGQIFGSIIGRAAGQSLGRALAKPEDIETGLNKMADHLNKTLPKQVDPVTRVDYITVGPGPKFTYHYSILSAPAQELDGAAIRAKTLPALVRKVCATEDMGIFFRSGVTVGYAYRGSDFRFVTKMEVTPQDCGYLP